MAYDPRSKHQFVSNKADGVDTTVVQPSDWNDTHKITLAAGKILGRDASTPGAAQELPLSFEATTNDAKFDTTGAVRLSSGTTAQRPVAPVTAHERWNETTQKKEIYNGTGWDNYALEAYVESRIQAAIQTSTPTGSIRGCFSATADAGWVRLNGLTIGSATSSATERANADCENLFKYLWDKLDDTRAPVVGGRGATAAADWAANKRITLPSARDRVLIGIATMGNSDAGLISLFNTTIMGNTGGAEQHNHGNTSRPHGGLIPVTGGGGNATSESHVHTVGNASAIPPGLVVSVQIKL